MKEIKTIVPRFSKLHKDVELFYTIDNSNNCVCYNRVAGFYHVSSKYYDNGTRPISGAAEYNEMNKLFHSVFKNTDSSNYVLSNELKPTQIV